MSLSLINGSNNRESRRTIIVEQAKPASGCGRDVYVLRLYVSLRGLLTLRHIGLFAIAYFYRCELGKPQARARTTKRKP